jgi:hypothetical protein
MDSWLSPGKLNRRALLSGVLAGGMSVLAGCGWDGHLDFFGYTTRPNIPDNIKTVYVPIFKNKAFQTGPYRGMEFELTRNVITQVEMKGYKVISDPNRADTELLGTIVTLTKNLINRTEQNEVREGEVVVGVEIVWRDLRSGVVLTNPRKPLNVLPPAELPTFDLDNPPRPDSLEKAVPVIVTLSARFLPEVGETNSTAQSKVCYRLAQQIANMMEKDWQLPPKPCPTPDQIPPERR